MKLLERMNKDRAPGAGILHPKGSARERSNTPHLFQSMNSVDERCLTNTLSKSLARIEQAGFVRAEGIDAKVIVGESGGQTPAGSAVQEADLDQVGFNDLLD